MITSPSNELPPRVEHMMITLNFVAVVVIAVLLFLILKRYSSPVALSYLIVRMGEAILL